MTVTTPREPQQDRSRATRLRLLEAAVDCLAELGWSGSTVAVVAERAGVSRGAAQHHFPTREALFTAAVQHVARMRGDEMRRELASHSEVPPTTYEVVEMIIENYVGSVFRAALELWVASSSEPALREEVVKLERVLGREMHLSVVAALGVDESVPGVRETIQATLDLARGLGLANLLTDDSRRRKHIMRQWARMLDLALMDAADASVAKVTSGSKNSA